MWFVLIQGQKRQQKIEQRSLSSSITTAIISFVHIVFLDWYFSVLFTDPVYEEDYIFKAEVLSKAV